MKIQDARAKFEAMGFTSEDVAKKVNELREAKEILPLDYSTTWLVFIACAGLSIIFAFLLKAEDKRKGYGLELPNIQE